MLPAPWIGLNPLMTGGYGWNELAEFVPPENSRLLPSLLSCGVLVQSFVLYNNKKYYFFTQVAMLIISSLQNLKIVKGGGRYTGKSL